MAKRGISLKRVTPLTKGASAGQGAALPKWIAPQPQIGDTDDPYSHGADVKAGRRITSEAVAAASQRMNASAPQKRRAPEPEPADDELDELGEGDDEIDTTIFDKRDHKRADNEIEHEIRAEVERRVHQRMADFNAMLGGAGPQPAPALAQAAQQAPILQYAPTADADIDRLWDWIRRDTDKGALFFGQAPTTSANLHRVMVALVQMEAVGAAVMRAVYYVDPSTTVHIGFLMVAPILTDDKLAVAHIYLCPEWRSRLPPLMHNFVEMAQKWLSPGTKLALLPGDAASDHLYKQVLTPLGFVAHTLYVR